MVKNLIKMFIGIQIIYYCIYFVLLAKMTESKEEIITWKKHKVGEKIGYNQCKYF